MTVPWRVELLDRRVHDRAGFDSGAPELDDYLRKFATQDDERNYARVFVAREPASPRAVGYFALSAWSFAREGMGPERARKLPRYPVPAVLLARLAVDRLHQGKRLGEFLLMDAFAKILRGNETIAVHAVAVDARDDSAVSFYSRYGFIRFVDKPHRLFLPIATIRKLVER